MPVASKQSGRRLTRCRTGCMKCRIRRRKCDEGKPRCQNCVERNFHCQYGPQLTFLTKNAHTVEPTEVEGAPNNYEAIRFVNEGLETDVLDVEEIQTLPAMQECVQPRGSLEPAQEAVCLPFQAAGPIAHSIPQPIPRGFSDNDESAVAGLLALGISTSGMVGPELNLSEFGGSPARQSTRGWTPRTPDVQALLSPSPNSQAHPSPIEALELIRHYRYEIAPWLDICDLGQMFGIQALQLAKESRPVWKSILNLSRSSNELSHFLEREDSEIGETLPPDIQKDLTTVALLRVFRGIKQYTSDISTAWVSARGTDLDILEELSQHTLGRNLNASIYWLFLRLDIGAALATDTTIKSPVPPTPPYMPDGDLEADPFGQVFCFALRPLWLCARAMEFIHNEEPSPQRPPLHTWMQLVEELEKWHIERPQGFQSMMELNVDDETGPTGRNFPVVLFANGAGVFSNQLYHTAMLLLLHSRPRTARTTDFPSMMMSPLWHAQRICSIALNNERRECWDSCLLASFLMASRRMTHEAQQQEILDGFQRIQKITGWDAGDFVRGLREEWSSPDT